MKKKNKMVRFQIPRDQFVLFKMKDSETLVKYYDQTITIMKLIDRFNIIKRMRGLRSN